MNTNCKFYDFYILLVLNIVLFLNSEGILSNQVYLIISIVALVYFFPFKYIQDVKRQTKFELFILFFIACVICISSISLYVVHGTSFKIIVLVFQILNIVLMLMQFSNTERSKLLIHVFASVLIAGTYFSG